jgi:murein DD-endopeptidase MepM/ murein hydrolase activator NlpD
VFGLFLSLWLPLSGLAGPVVDPDHGTHEAQGVLPRGSGGGVSEASTPAGGAGALNARALADSFQLTGWLRALPWWPEPADAALQLALGGLWRAPVRPAAAAPPLISDGQFVWGPNAAGFDPHAYLQSRGSPLLPYAEHLALWSDYSSVNPQVVLAVLEVQLGWVSSLTASVAPGQVESQIETTAMELAAAFYEHLYIWGARRPEGQSPPAGPLILFDNGTAQLLDPATSSGSYAIARVLGSGPAQDGLQAQAVTAGETERFTQVFGSLFPAVDLLDESNQITPQAAPPSDLLQFPFPLGATWVASGPHSWNGGSYPPPFSSLDFFTGGATCSNPPNLYAVAAATGAANRPYGYNCWLELDHGAGWVTSYYHLRNLYSGAPLSRNGKLGTIACELCAGGFSTGPHVHFSLKYNGAYASLEGVKLSGWTVHVGAIPYDSGSFTRGGVTLNPYSPIYNDYQTYFGQGPRSLRFYGNGTGDIDRVKLRMTDLSIGPPVDVGAQDFTIEWWMRALPGENAAPAIACGPGDAWRLGNILLDRDRFAQNRDHGVSLAGGLLTFGVGGETAGQLTICGSTDVRDGEWHHVAVQRRRSDGWLWLFVDGVLEAQADGPNGDISYPADAALSDGCGGPCINDPFLVLGAEKHGVDPALRSYSGWLDELRVSNVLRYGGGFSPAAQPFPNDANTLALLHFDDSPGTSAYDTSGFPGGPSNGALKVGGTPAGPAWSTEVPFVYATPTPGTGTPSATPTGTASATPSPSATPTASPTPTSTPSPSVTASPTPTATPSPTASATSTASPSATSSPTSTPSPTPTASSTHTPTPTPTSVGTPTAEDINQDGQVNVLDVQLCVNVVLGLVSDPAIVARADVNGDGLANVLDVQIVVNAALAG